MSGPNYTTAAELEERAMRHFAALPPEEQEAAIRRLAAAGYGPATIASATRLAREVILEILARAD